MLIKNFFLSLFSFACLSSFAQSGTTMQVLKSFPIGGAGGWDYLAVGPVNDWLYVSHGTQVNIINKKTGDSVGMIENTTGVHGIAFDVKDNKGFTSNGRLNTVTVFDLSNNKVLAQIPVGSNPDAILYDTYSKKIITCNGRGKNLSIVDPTNNTLVDSIAVGGKPETAVSNGAGKLFVNIEDKNEIVEVDLKTMKVLNHWTLAPGDGPSGLAYDSKTERLFSTCDKLLVIMNAADGTIVDKLPIGDGCDGAAFDPQLNNVYTSNGDGTITVIHEDSKNKFHVVGNIATKRSARTIALDENSHQLFLPTAEMEAMQAGQTGRPKMKPGTFQVIVVGN